MYRKNNKIYKKDNQKILMSQLMEIPPSQSNKKAVI